MRNQCRSDRQRPNAPHRRARSIATSGHFQPPREPSIPSVSAASWPTSPIDHFVLHQLEARGLAPARPADRRTLIRRATFDLHGLPPTPEEVDAFVADPSPAAFAKVVERLLALPRYGERWGRHWLDIARYADSNGMDENMAMAHAWRYRDWVIAALNRDLPYDEFLTAQLAGDLLPATDEAARQEQLVATGFLVLGPKMLAEDDPVKMEMDIIDEQVDTIGRAFMGLTLGCAALPRSQVRSDPHGRLLCAGRHFQEHQGRWRNHRVVAMWSERMLGTKEELDDLAAHEQRIHARIEEQKGRIAAANDALLDEARGKLAQYLTAATTRRRQQATRDAFAGELAAERFPTGAVTFEAEGFARGNVLRDTENYGVGIGVILNAGDTPNEAEYDIELPTAGTYQLAIRYAAAEARPVRLAIDGHVLRDDACGETTGSWHADTQRWSIEAIVPLAAGRHVVRLERGEAFPHIDKLAFLPASYLPGPIAGQWKIAGQLDDFPDLNPAILDAWAKYLEATTDDSDSVLRVWYAMQPASAGASTALIDESLPIAQALLANPRPTSPAALAARYEQLCHEARMSSASDAASAAFRKLLADPAGPFAVPKEADRYYSAETKERLAKLKAEIAELQKATPEIPRALAVDEGKPQNLRVHLRGSHLTLGDEAPRRFPRVLAGDDQPLLGNAASGRLELARWLTRGDHPLASRVMVNRIWQGHFGEGLVRSPDNFGRLGEPPDNRPLLDWLATRFVADGWSIKAMHRRIMLSSAYQMSTARDARAAEIDPDNRLLWRMNRRRLEAEEIRDAILAVSGPLDEAMGGTLLKNANHTYVTSTASSNEVNYDNARRSVYLPIVRSTVYEVLQAFDFADPSTMNGKRPSTTVAPQALFMMNSPLVEHRMRAMGEDLLARDDLDDAGRVRLTYERAYSRPPTAHEVERALDFIAAYQAELTNSNNDNDKIEPDVARRRAWQALCRVIVSSNEFVYVE